MYAQEEKFRHHGIIKYGLANFFLCVIDCNLFGQLFGSQKFEGEAPR